MLPVTPSLCTLSILLVSICPCLTWPSKERVGMDTDRATDLHGAQIHSTAELGVTRDESQGHYVTSASSQSSGKSSSKFVTFILNVQGQNTQNATNSNTESENKNIASDNPTHGISQSPSSLSMKRMAFSKNQNLFSQGNSMNSHNVNNKNHNYDNTYNDNNKNNKQSINNLYQRHPSLPGKFVESDSFHLPDRISNLEMDAAGFSRGLHQSTSTETNSFLIRPKRSGTFDDMHSSPVISFRDNEEDLQLPLQAFAQESYPDAQSFEAMALQDLIRRRLAKIGLVPASIDVEFDVPFFSEGDGGGVIAEDSDPAEGNRLSLFDDEQMMHNEAGQDGVFEPDDVTKNPINVLLSDVAANSISKRGGRIFNYLRQMDGRMKERKPLRSRAGYPLSMRRPRLRHNSESIVRRQPYRQPLPVLEPVSTSEYSRSCKPERGGLKPLTCPSANDICLYDAMMCDGKKDCPLGEDETFSLCVFRHWTFKIQRRLQNLESRPRSSRRVG